MSKGAYSCDSCDHKREPVTSGPPNRSSLPPDARKVWVDRDRTAQFMEKQALKSNSRLMEQRPVSERWCAVLSKTSSMPSEYALCQVENPDSDNACGKFNPVPGWTPPIEPTPENVAPHPTRAGFAKEPEVREEIKAEGKISIGRTSTGEQVEISRAGLTTAYGVFGQPGQGKSYFLKKVIRGVTTVHSADQPSIRAGGVVFDPKGELVEPTRAAVQAADADGEGPSRKFLSLNPADMVREKTVVNLLNAPIAATDLGKLLAQVAFSVMPMREPYFVGALALYLSALCRLQQLRLGRTITLREILDLSFQRLPELREGLITEATANIMTHFSADKAKKAKYNATIAEINFHVRILGNFFSEHAKSEVPLALFQQVFSEFGAPDRWNFSSGSNKARDLYSEIINNGLVLAVGASADKSGLRRPLATLVKSIFQQVVLSRFAISVTRASTRPVFLLMDEYHTVASDVPQMGIGDNFFISQARQFGCFTMLVTQNRMQLETSQLGQNWEAAFSNMLAKIFFAIGDPETAVFASKLAGDRETSDEGIAVSTEAQGTGSLTRTTNLVERPRIPARVFTGELSRGKVVIIGSLDGGFTRAPLEVVTID